jgi:hypothetical protein
MQFAEWPKRADLELACAGADTQEAFDRTMSAFHSPHSIPEAIAKPLAAYAAGLLEASMTPGGALTFGRSA